MSSRASSVFSLNKVFIAGKFVWIFMNQAGKQLVVNTIVIGKFPGLKKQLIN